MNAWTTALAASDDSDRATERSCLYLCLGGIEPQSAATQPVVNISQTGR